MGGIPDYRLGNKPMPHNITNPTWEYEGIKGDGKKPDCVGKHNGVCVILACAEGVYQDYEEIKKILSSCGKGYTLLAVNDIACYVRDRVYALITSDPELAPGWINWRKKRFVYGPDARNVPLVFSQESGEHVDVSWSGIGNQVGTSGMVAILMAICMGFDKIILGGMPLDWDKPHFFSPYVLKIPLSEQLLNKNSWEYAINKLPTFAKKVRSISGLTKEWLGAPTTEWIKS